MLANYATGRSTIVSLLIIMLANFAKMHDSFFWLCVRPMF